MNNIRLRIPTLAPFLPTEAVAFLDNEITMSVVSGGFLNYLTGCHYNNDMFSDSLPGLYQEVQSPVMSLSKWFSYWPGYHTSLHRWLDIAKNDSSYFTYAFHHNFTIGSVK